MKNKHGGLRKGAGPKFLPKGEAKIQVQVGIEEVFIEEYGGLKRLQKDIKQWFYREVDKKQNCESWIHEERVKHNDDNYCPICGEKLKTLSEFK